MAKTALTELIEDLEIAKHLPFTIDGVISMIKGEYLEKERVQIIEAHQHGQKILKGLPAWDAEQYYKENLE